ncbi:hypothetical protein SDC9_108798 [bioreactor metagenome]|uniref:HTH tetR-type domain-containing protein n=1 Tax=bioreactor metagenome TaxID=1076179 RepID=A0A645BJL0_9ZZZZ
MPKSLSESERQAIKKRLMEEAQACLAQYGMRKTTVDELVRRVNIPKGTFYLFYPSKELLFFETYCTLHDELQATLLKWIDELGDNVNADTVTQLLFRLYKKTDSTFLYSFIANGELELLVRKLPPEVTAAHIQKDDFSMERLLSLLPGVRTEGNIKIFSAVLRAVFCTMLHKREIGEDVFDDTILVMLHGVVRELFEGKVL